MKKFAIILSFAVLLTGCGCMRQDSQEPIEPMVSSSMPSIPDVISSIPMPPLPDDIFSSTVEPFISSTIEELKPTMGADFEEIGALPSKPITWGPGTRKNSENRSEACVALQDSYTKYGATFIMPNEPKIYLTFDQGYENGYTEKILDTLKEKNVKAVFFITGHYAKSAPKLVQRMIDEGHTVGNHSMNHLNHSTSSVETAHQDTKDLHDYVKENFNYDMNLFRYPEGTFNERALALHQKMGYKTVFWSFAYADWDPKNQLPEQTALKKLSDGLQPGSVILMHTVGATNAAILGDFIDLAKNSGYSIELFQ